MKLLLDDILYSELKDYLLSQDGINEVDIVTKNFLSEINIKFDNRLTPLIILKYIELFQENNYSTLVSFDKGKNIDIKILKYVINDMCCEFCYKGLIRELFANKYIKSVKSNFDFYEIPINIEFIIEYDKNYSEEELIKYINDKK